MIIAFCLMYLLAGWIIMRLASAGSILSNQGKMPRKDKCTCLLLWPIVAIGLVQPARFGILVIKMTLELDMATTKRPKRTNTKDGGKSKR